MFQIPGKYVAKRLQCRCALYPQPLSTAHKEGAIPPGKRFRTTISNPSRRSNMRKRKSEWPRVETLGMKALGTPGHVLILKNRAKRLEASRPVVEKDGQGMIWKDADGVLQEVNQRRILSAEELMMTLENFRSQMAAESPLSKEEWARIRDSLCHSYTAEQLLGYTKDLRKNADSSPNEGIDNLRGWEPDASIGPMTGGKGRVRTTKTASGARITSGKKMLAETILREHWRLRLRDESGRLDMHFNPSVLTALLHIKSKFLGSCAEVHNVGVSIFKTEGTVTITGPAERCLKLQEELERIRSELRTKTVAVSERGPVFGDPNLEESCIFMLQNRYNIFCEKGKAAKALTLYYTDDSDIENALRTLELSMILPLDRSDGLFTYSAESQTAIMYPFVGPRFLTWPDRKSEWVRWTKPSLSADISGGRLARRPPSMIYAFHPTAPFTQISNTFFQDADRSNVDPEHRDRLRETVTASLGKFLFKRQPSYEPGEELSFSSFKDPHRSFVTDVPNTPNFLSELKQLNKDDTKATCRIRLMPSPRNAMSAPPIELELELSSSNQFLEANVVPTITRASAIINESHVDMLLPDTTVDLRFTKTTHYDLFKGREAVDPVVRSLGTCVADLPARFPLSGPQPALPKFHELSIPKSLTGPSKAPSEDSQSTAGSQYVNPEYIIPPLEHLVASKISRFAYKDFGLDFASQSLGPMLPRRTTNCTLSLGRYDNELRPSNASPNKPLTSVPKDEMQGSLQFAFRPLFTRACQLAFELGAPLRDPRQLRSRDSA